MVSVNVKTTAMADLQEVAAELSRGHCQVNASQVETVSVS